MSASSKEFNPLQFLSFKGPYRILHMTWFAFFLTFMCWFNMAPLAAAMKEDLNLTDGDLKVLMICNVALTIPARIIIGMLLDKFGPRKVFSGLLVVMSIPCFIFAMSSTMIQLVITRLLLGIIGAGFVIGIRMVAEWFPPKDVGEAEGIYGGFGNFGSAASAFTLPTIAIWASSLFGGDESWRYAIAMTGAMCLIYGFIYYASVTDTPPGKTYHKPKRAGAMEVTSMASLYGLIFMQVPMILALGLLVWKLHNFEFLPTQGAHIGYGVLVSILIFQAYKAWTINVPNIREGYEENDKWEFRQVAILDLAYFVTFGSELAVVSMLPLFFKNTFDLTLAQAGMIAASFAFMNLFARPMGGFLSDKMGSRRKTLTFLLAGLAVGYFLMSNINSSWPIPVAIAATMGCSFFVQAGEGAVFAVVPLVKKRVTGQIAGMVGAYGNVGAVCLLTVFSFVTPPTFFLTISGCAIVCMIASLALKEPKGSFADAHHDEADLSDPAATGVTG